MSELTREEALQIAAMYGLTTEIKYAIGCGQSPEQALRDWDIIKELKFPTPSYQLFE